MIFPPQFSSYFLPPMNFVRTVRQVGNSPSGGEGPHASGVLKRLAGTRKMPDPAPHRRTHAVPTSHRFTSNAQPGVPDPGRRRPGGRGRGAAGRLARHGGGRHPAVAAGLGGGPPTIRPGGGRATREAGAGPGRGPNGAVWGPPPPPRGPHARAPISRGERRGRAPEGHQRSFAPP